MYSTYNSGTNWGLINLGTLIDFSEIYILNSAEIWVAGANEIHKTVNNGISWSSTSITSTSISINSIIFINSNEGWICGDLGKVMHTLDGGQTWNIQTTPYPDHYSKIEMIDGSTGYMTSHTGQIVSTNDGGTWLGLNQAQNALNDIDMLNSQNGLCIGNSGECLYTSDFGSNWNQHPDISSSDDLINLSYYLDSSICIVGKNGIVYLGEYSATLNAPVDTINNLSIPNAFSPNGDGVNDFLEISGLTDYPNTFQIFNRWGDVVFTVKNYNNQENSWNGESNFGESLDAGTYYYTFSSNDPNIKEKSGWIQLLK